MTFRYLPPSPGKSRLRPGVRWQSEATTPLWHAVAVCFKNNRRSKGGQDASLFFNFSLPFPVIKPNLPLRLSSSLALITAASSPPVPSAVINGQDSEPDRNTL
jgi:hypothetical protein